MINYIIAVILGVLLGQVTNHFIRRLPDIIEEDNEFKTLIPTLKKDFKWDYKYSIILVILNVAITYFVGNTYMSYIYMILVSQLLVVTAIDFKMQMIPDTVQVVVLLLGIIVTAIDYTNWLGHLIGMILGIGIFALIAVFSKIVFRKDGMGMGDIKLMAGLGLIFGIEGIPTSFYDFLAKSDVLLTITVLSFFMAAIVAVILLVTNKTDKFQYMAFGPYIVIATICIILFGTAPFLDGYFFVCTKLADVITELMLKFIN